jgi:hypothetical protein
MADNSGFQSHFNRIVASKKKVESSWKMPFILGGIFLVVILFFFLIIMLGGSKKNDLLAAVLDRSLRVAAASV